MCKQKNTFIEELKSENLLLRLLLQDYDLCSIRNLDFIMRIQDRIMVDSEDNEIKQESIKKYLADNNYAIYQVGMKLRGDFDYDPTLEAIILKKDEDDPDYFDIYICRPAQD